MNNRCKSVRPHERTQGKDIRAGVARHPHRLRSRKTDLQDLQANYPEDHQNKEFRFIKPAAHDLVLEAEEQTSTEDQIPRFPEQWTSLKDDTISDECRSSDEEQRGTRRITALRLLGTT